MSTPSPWGKVDRGQKVTNHLSRMTLEVGDLDPIQGFNETRPGDELSRAGDPRITTGLRPRLSAAAIVGLGFFASAVFTHLIFFRRAKRHLGF